MPFSPKFTISAEIANALMRIEASKQAIQYLPITSSVLASLRESARLSSTHYSTTIEGNRLTQEQVGLVIEAGEVFAGRERDEKEVLGYYAALERLERFASDRTSVTEGCIKTLHALVMNGGKKRVKPTAYRDGQNVIRDSRSRSIVYLPPEAKDVPVLMRELVEWIGEPKSQLPFPIRAGIAHYQFATIHPYYDGNGRTARLLTTLILHLGGYGLKGLYSLEEYYVRDLPTYYERLSVGPSHNYYMGRAEADISAWVAYFCEGVADSFYAVEKRAQDATRIGAEDTSQLLRKLDPRQRQVLPLFTLSDSVTSGDIERLFALSQRTARNILREWVAVKFLDVVDASKKNRKYALAKKYRSLV